jgi:predicted transcriptional regulator
MSNQNGFQRRRALIQEKFNEKYQQAAQSVYVTVNLSLIYQDVAKELGFTPGHVRNVVKGYK